MTATAPHSTPTGSAPAGGPWRRSSGCSPTRRRPPSARVETGTRGSGGDRTLVIDAAAERRRVRRAGRAARQGYRFARSPRSAARSTSAIPMCRRDHRPDRRLAERQARDLALRAVDRGRRRADDGRRRVRLRPRLRARARSGGRGAARAPGSTASCSTRRSASAVTATAGSSWSGSSPPIRAGSRRRSTRSSSAAYRLRALGAIASSLCQVAAARFDGMVSLRRCRGVDAAAGQLIVREAGGARQLPGLRRPARRRRSTPTPHSPVVAARTLETLPSSRGSRRDRLDPRRADRRATSPAPATRRPPTVDLAPLAADSERAGRRLHGPRRRPSRCRRPRGSAGASGSRPTSARCARCSTRCSSAPAQSLGAAAARDRRSASASS